MVLPVVITRVVAGADVWTATTTIPLAKLLTPGAQVVQTSHALAKGKVPSKASLEESVAKASNNDEKKRAQAALQDYENLVTRAKGQAAIYASAGTELEIELRMMPSPLVPMPPVPLPPAMSLEQFIPPREPLPPFPTFEAAAVMRREVRKIIALLIKEYDALFNDSSDENVRQTFPIINIDIDIHGCSRHRYVCNTTEEGTGSIFPFHWTKRIQFASALPADDHHVGRQEIGSGTDKTEFKKIVSRDGLIVFIISRVIIHSIILRKATTPQHESHCPWKIVGKN